MKTYKFKYPFQGNRKGDTVTEDRHGQLLVKAGSNNVMWGPKDVFRAVGMGLIEDAELKHAFIKHNGANKMPSILFCSHPSPRRENDELFCEICKKRWEAGHDI